MLKELMYGRQAFAMAAAIVGFDVFPENLSLGISSAIRDFREALQLAAAVRTETLFPDSDESIHVNDEFFFAM
jgi:hypothetical protein